MATTPARGAGASRPARLAVIDSGSGFAQSIAEQARAAGWSPEVVEVPASPDALRLKRLSAVVIDLPAPADGWAYLALLCSRLPGLVVVVCSGRSTVAERVRGLRMGADDWVTMPVHPEELVARLDAMTRVRSSAADAHGRRSVGEIEIRNDQFEVLASGRRAWLTRREFELIQFFADHGGEVMTREDIYERVWGYAMPRGDRSVDVFVRKLRTKLERLSPSWSYVHTHYGIGYRFAAEAHDAPARIVTPDLSNSMEFGLSRSVHTPAQV